MKTPWSYISRLSLGRRGPAVAQGQSEVDETENTAQEPVQSGPEEHLEREVTGPQPSAEASNRTPDDNHKADKAVSHNRENHIEGAVANEVEGGEPAAASDVHSPASATHAPSALKRRGKAAKSAPTKPRVKALARTNRKIATHLSPEQSVLADQFKLDDEIRQLRLQLAAKLKRQNAQLREMLERFNAN